MSKSIYVIGGLGLGSCLVLSMMMQHLLEVKKERDRPAVVLEVEQVLGSRLVGPASLVAKDTEGHVVELHLKVLAGLDKGKIARSAGNLVWLRSHAEGALEELTVVVGDEDSERTERFAIERPFRSRPRSWSPVRQAQGQPQKPPAAGDGSGHRTTSKPQASAGQPTSRPATGSKPIK